MLMELDDETYLVDKISNFEHVASNVFRRLIRGSFEVLANIIDVWFPYKCAMDAWKDWFSYLHMPKGNKNFFHGQNYFFS